MGWIGNKDRYPNETSVNKTDFIIGTDQSGGTKTFQLDDVQSLLDADGYTLAQFNTLITNSALKVDVSYKITDAGAEDSQIIVKASSVNTIFSTCYNIADQTKPYVYTIGTDTLEPFLSGIDDAPDTIYEYTRGQEGWNVVKLVVRDGNTIEFNDSINIARYGTPTEPLVGDLILSDTDLIEGSFVWIYHKQDTAPVINYENLTLGSQVIGSYEENPTPVLNVIIINYIGDGYVEVTYRGSVSAPSFSQTDWISGLWESPTDKTYTLVLNSPYGGTISSTTSKCVSGTCTASFYINEVELGGTANAVSSTEVTEVHASNNTFAAGDDIKVVISANASTEDMSLTIEYNYTLDA